MYRSAGGQDEECYAVPGLTILETGLPKLPHLPSRNPESPYYRSDEAVYLEPPLSFYVQALFYAVLPDLYGTARLVSAFAGIAILFAMARLARLSGGTPRAALWGAGLFMMSRWFYFNTIAARPDALCTLFGFLAILSTEAWTRHRTWRWLVLTGLWIGLGGMTHPFALVYAIQLAVWVFLVERGWKRLLGPLAMAAVAVAVATLWIPLILQFPETFQIQFRNQFLHDRGGSLLLRSLWPWESIAFHVGFLWPHINPWQFLLAIGGAIACLVFSRREGRSLLSTIGWLSISGAWLLCGLVGAHHPVFGYFSYPSALAFIGVGWTVDRLSRWLSERGRVGRAAGLGFAMLLVVAMLLGSGIRVTWAYFRNWNRIDFDAPRFVEQLLARLPRDATFLVDEEFALDFIRDGRRTLAFRAIVEGAVPPSTPYDYRIEGRSTDRYFAHLRWDDNLLWTEGDPRDPYGIYVKVHRRKASESSPLR